MQSFYTVAEAIDKKNELTALREVGVKILIYAEDRAAAIRTLLEGGVIHGKHYDEICRNVGQV